MIYMNRLFLILIATLCIFSIGKSAYPASLDSDWKGLIIDGRNFWFMITEPDGWNVEINDANARMLNAYFVPNGHTFNKAPSVMYIRVMDKKGLTVEQHLKADTENFKKRHSIQLKKFDVKDIRYRHATSLYLIDNEFCDYLCYIDPGEGYRSYLIFVLSSDMNICGKYTDVFRTFLKSFLWGGDDVRIQ